MTFLNCSQRTGHCRCVVRVVWPEWRLAINSTRQWTVQTFIIVRGCFSWFAGGSVTAVWHSLPTVFFTPPV
jgi:hypothetical protein